MAIKKIELIERLTEKNLIKDFFEQLAGGKVLGELEGRAARLGCDLDQPHLVLAAQPGRRRVSSRRCASACPGSLFDRRDDSMRALVRVPPRGGSGCSTTLRQRPGGARRPCRDRRLERLPGAGSFPAGFEEARARAPRDGRASGRSRA